MSCMDLLYLVLYLVFGDFCFVSICLFYELYGSFTAVGSSEVRARYRLRSFIERRRHHRHRREEGQATEERCQGPQKLQKINVRTARGPWGLKKTISDYRIPHKRRPCPYSLHQSWKTPEILHAHFLKIPKYPLCRWFRGFGVR